MKTVYTAIFGNYDDLKPPLIRKATGWKYVCFTDQPIESDVWEIRNVPVINNDPSKTARYYKIMFHKHIETDLSLWIDATFIINTNLNRWWRRFQDPFTAIRHPFDNCIYTDAQSCINAEKGDRGTIEKQVAHYRSIGVPMRNGLISSGILMRRKEERTIQFCETWWDQVKRWSNRDQIAYGYANFKHTGVVNLIDWNYTTENEFIHVPHLHKPWRNQKLKEIYETHSR